MDIFIQTILFTMTFFNLAVALRDGKKIYKFYRRMYERKDKIKKNIKKQQAMLNKSLGNLKIIRLERPIQAKFTKDEVFTFNKIMDNIKLKNIDLYMFIQTLLKFVDKEDIRSFINRAEDLSIDYISPKEMRMQDGIFTVGTYNGQENEIRIYFDNNNSVLDHELLHASSSNDVYARVGFSVNFEKTGLFGEGLNEGYTELLNQRIFNHPSYSYSYLINLTELIENFYENKGDMLKDYFHADLFALISELLKSMSLEEAIDIISSMDLFLNQSDASFFEFIKLRQKILKIYERKFVCNNSKRLVK